MPKFEDKLTKLPFNAALTPDAVDLANNLSKEQSRAYINELLDSLTIETAEAFQDMMREFRGKNEQGTDLARTRQVNLTTRGALSNVMMKIGLSLDSLSRLRLVMQKTDPVQGSARDRVHVEIPSTLSDKEWQDKYESAFNSTLADKKRLT